MDWTIEFSRMVLESASMEQFPALGSKAPGKERLLEHRGKEIPVEPTAFGDAVTFDPKT